MPNPKRVPKPPKAASKKKIPKAKRVAAKRAVATAPYGGKVKAILSAAKKTWRPLKDAAAEADATVSYFLRTCEKHGVKLERRVMKVDKPGRKPSEIRRAA